MRRVIISNKAKCLLCGDVIESVTKHDLETCRCGNLSVDGGLFYLKRDYKTKDWEELSETEEY